MKSNHPDELLTPYPWPVKKALLYLLELPSTATEEEYKNRWMEIFHPLQLNGTNLNNDLLEKHINGIMAEHKVNYTKASEMAVQTAKGRKLIASAYSHAPAANSNPAANENDAIAQRRTAFNRRIDELTRPISKGGKGLTFDQALNTMRSDKNDAALLAAMNGR